MANHPVADDGDPDTADDTAAPAPGTHSELSNFDIQTDGPEDDVQ